MKLVKLATFVLSVVELVVLVYGAPDPTKMSEPKPSDVAVEVSKDPARNGPAQDDVSSPLAISESGSAVKHGPSAKPSQPIPSTSENKTPTQTSGKARDEDTDSTDTASTRPSPSPNSGGTALEILGHVEKQPIEVKIEVGSAKGAEDSKTQSGNLSSASSDKEKILKRLAQAMAFIQMLTVENPQGDIRLILDWQHITEEYTKAVQKEFLYHRDREGGNELAAAQAMANKLVAELDGYASVHLKGVKRKEYSNLQYRLSYAQASLKSKAEKLGKFPSKLQHKTVSHHSHHPEHPDHPIQKALVGVRAEDKPESEKTPVEYEPKPKKEKEPKQGDELPSGDKKPQLALSSSSSSKISTAGAFLPEEKPQPEDEKPARKDDEEPSSPKEKAQPASSDKGSNKETGPSTVPAEVYSRAGQLHLKHEEPTETTRPTQERSEAVQGRSEDETSTSRLSTSPTKDQGSQDVTEIKEHQSSSVQHDRKAAVPITDGPEEVPITGHHHLEQEDRLVPEHSEAVQGKPDQGEKSNQKGEESPSRSEKPQRAQEGHQTSTVTASQTSTSPTKDQGSEQVAEPKDHQPSSSSSFQHDRKATVPKTEGLTTTAPTTVPTVQSDDSVHGGALKGQQGPPPAPVTKPAAPAEKGDETDKQPPVPMPQPIKGNAGREDDGDIFN